MATVVSMSSAWQTGGIIHQGLIREVKIRPGLSITEGCMCMLVNILDYVDKPNYGVRIVFTLLLEWRIIMFQLCRRELALKNLKKNMQIQ